MRPGGVVTLAATPQCSEATARALTDQLRQSLSELRQSLSEKNRLAAQLPRSPRPATTSSVYFIQTGVYDDDPIKIGVAYSVATRLSQLQTGSPWELRLLGTIPGGVAEESALHKRFSHLHIRGEWFEGASELLSFIAESSR